jgi:(1->4)-alpha-D-glucan 1-alpha-D-glucosylmutase
MSDAEHLEYIERIVRYMDKALREAKVHSSWINPAQDYEQAVSKFTRAVMIRQADNEFLHDVEQFHEQMNHAGLCNALAQLLVKITVPGVPDFYQGSELWSFSLVDPDNRRPVDYETRQELLELLVNPAKQDQQKLIDELLNDWRDGRIKLFTTHLALQLRRDERQLFLDGEYIPSDVVGTRQNHVCSFSRRREEKSILVVVPRLTMPLMGGKRPPLGKACWEDTAIVLPGTAPRRWRNAFTGESLVARRRGEEHALAIADVLQRFPVAALVSGS